MASESIAVNTILPEKRSHPAFSFIAGMMSGTTKCLVGHPFDTIKTRLQTNPSFKGPWECLVKTLKFEGVKGLYKGLTPPLVGWLFMDSVMLGSLHTYRRWLKTLSGQETLSLLNHGLAGAGAGFTVSFVAAPIEHVKARLQVQYSSADRIYSGPIDAYKKIYLSHGIRGIYTGLFSTIMFRTVFFVWWSTYELYTRWFQKYTSLSLPSINFWAGGLSAQTFWLASFPLDVVKQRIMTDSLDLDKRRYKTWRQGFISIWRQEGIKGYYRGFVPCVLRAFPANAAALFMFERTMRLLEG